MRSLGLPVSSRLDPAGKKIRLYVTGITGDAREFWCQSWVDGRVEGEEDERVRLEERDLIRDVERVVVGGVGGVEEQEGNDGEGEGEGEYGAE